jgi:hypothetical protein
MMALTGMGQSDETAACGPIAPIRGSMTIRSLSGRSGHEPNYEYALYIKKPFATRNTQQPVRTR